MRRINYILVMLIAAITVISCGKDGAVGPAGSTGPTGQQGPVGPAGPTGANGQSGSIIYSGTTTPNATTGAVGDFYINLSTGLLYGPKTTAGWGTGVSLKGAAGVTGATGATGAAGSQIYSGSGAPAGTKGVTGDYYLDINNYMLYGPKTAAGWGIPISLQGPAGPQGPQGPPGNANVITDVFTVTGADWLYPRTYEFGTDFFDDKVTFSARYYTRANTSITQDVLTNGLVLVYFTPSPVDNPNQWMLLPYQFDADSYFTNYVYVATIGRSLGAGLPPVGLVTLMYFFTIDPATAGTPQIPNLSTYVDQTRSFKIVAITGTALSLVKQNHININDYQAISRVTGLWQQDKLSQ